MSETRTVWWLLGHPAWPMGKAHATPADAERSYWDLLVADGDVREGMEIVRIDTIRFKPYTPSRPQSTDQEAGR